MRGGFEIGRVFGWPVKVDGFVLVLTVASIMGACMYQEYLTPRLAGSLTPLILLGSILVHELAHARAARRCGVIVQEIVISKWGGAATFASEVEDPRDELAVAWAGPAANLGLAAHAWLVLYWGTDGVAFDVASVLALPAALPGSQSLAATVLAVNLFLALTNLLPLLPLDGGRMLRSVLARSMGRLDATRWACRTTAASCVVLVALPGFVPRLETFLMAGVGIWLVIGARRERQAIERDAFLSDSAAVLWQLSHVAAVECGQESRVPVEPVRD